MLGGRACMYIVECRMGAGYNNYNEMKRMTEKKKEKRSRTEIFFLFFFFFFFLASSFWGEEHSWAEGMTSEAFWLAGCESVEEAGSYPRELYVLYSRAIHKAWYLW